MALTATGDPVYVQVEAELATLSIDTEPEVEAFRTPGERWSNAKSRTAGNMKTVLDAVQSTLGRQRISRKRVRAAARRLLNEGLLS